ncbi:MAG: transcription initiation factor IIB [Thermoplasmata archaeon]|nr:transcription initiation factor IIB [Thermoplasmata archaeon]
MVKFEVEGGKGAKMFEETVECPECSSTHLVRDYSRGELYCDSCGLVVSENFIQEEQEWRSYTPEQTAKRSRIGLPSTYTLHDKGLSTEISGFSRDSYGKSLSTDARRKFYRMRRLHNRLKFSSQKEKRLAHGLSLVDRYVSYLGLSRHYKEKCALLYRKAVAQNLIRGRSVQTVSGAVIYAVCRMNSIPRTLDEIAEACSLSSKPEKKRIGKAYRALVRTLKLNVPIVKPENYLSRFSADLGLSNQTYAEVVKIVRKAQDVEKLSSAIPAGVVAAAIYVASQKTKEKITQKKIADAVGISEPTLRYRYHDLMGILGSKYIVKKGPGRRVTA